MGLAEMAAKTHLAIAVGRRPCSRPITPTTVRLKRPLRFKLGELVLWLVCALAFISLLRTFLLEIVTRTGSDWPFVPVFQLHAPLPTGPRA